MMPPANHPDAPHYWMYETSGQLEPVIWSYLQGEKMPDSQIRIMRAYLRQWFASPVWEPGGPSGPLEALRDRIDDIATRDDIEGILDDAMDLGIDPL